MDPSNGHDRASNASESTFEDPSSDTGPQDSALTNLGLTLNMPWMLRLQSRNLELCTWFGIPQSETLLDDFNCALRKRVLLQGRIFVFDNFVCFSSNVFGYVKKKVIRIIDINSLAKKSHFRIPNSIEVTLANGRTEFFTSFLARETAYCLILSLCKQARPSHDFSPTKDRMMRCSLASGTEEVAATEPSEAYESPARGGGGRAEGAAEVTGSVQVSQSSGELVPILDGREAEGVNEEEECKVWSFIEKGPVPARLPGSKLLMSASFPGTPADFFELFLSNESHLLEDTFEQMGNRRINLESWKRTEMLGHVRDIQFVAPIKGAFSNWGVPETNCHQSHRFCRYAGDYLVFETSQTMSDIPYGDCFTVDKRWDLRPDPNAPEGQPQLLLDVYLRVPFSRTCFFKKIIEMGTFSQSKETVAFMVQRLQQELQKRLASRKTVEHRGSFAMRPLQVARMLSEAVQMQLSSPSSRHASASGHAADSPSRRPSSFFARVEEMKQDPVPSGQPSPSFGLKPAAPRSSGWSLRRSLLSLLEAGSPTMGLLCALLLLVQLCLILSFLHLPSPSSGPWRAASEGHLQDAAMQPDGPREVDYDFWVRKVELLSQEMELLQRRAEYIAAELGAVMRILAAAGISGGTADTAEGT